MKKTLILAFAAAVLTTGSVSAQSSEQACRDSYDIAAPMFAPIRIPTRTPGNISVENGWCVATDVAAARPSRRAPELNFRRLAWRGETTGGAFPENFGLQAQIEPGSSSNRSSLPGRSAATRNGIQFSAQINSNTGAKTLDISEFKLDFPGQNSMNLRLQLGNINLSSKSSMQLSMMNVSANLLRLELNSDGQLKEQFEQMFGPVDDIRSNDRQKANEAIAAMPDNFMSSQSKSSATRLLAALPDMRGNAVLELTSDGSLSPSKFVVLNHSNFKDENLEGFLSGLKFEVSYRQ